MITLYIVGGILLIFLWYVLTPRKKNAEGFKLWNFDANSRHARYYKWAISDNLPQGGCAYFWSMFALILFAPVVFTLAGFVRALIWFVSFIPQPKTKEKTPAEWDAYWEKRHRAERRADKISIIVGKVALGFLVLLLLAGIAYLFTLKSEKLFTLLQIVGFLALLIGVLIFLFWLFEKISFGKHLLKVLRPLSYPFKYLGSMIVAIYTKSCPKITWTYGQPVLAETKTEDVG